MRSFRRGTVWLCLAAVAFAVLVLTHPGNLQEPVAPGADRTSPVRGLSTLTAEVREVEATAPEAVSIRNLQRSKHDGRALDLGVGVGVALSTLATLLLAVMLFRRDGAFPSAVIANGVRAPPVFVF